MKILLAIPTFETIRPETFAALWQMDKGGNDVIFEAVTGYDTATARNKIAQRALDLNADYCLMVDSDVIVPQNALIDLLDGGYDVNLGCCPRRNGSDITLYRIYRPDGSEYYDYTVDATYTGQEVRELSASGNCKFRVHGGGVACALIRVDVFRQLNYPWFDWVNYGDGGLLSEDLYFCECCKAAQIPIFGDARVLCGHISQYTQYP